MYNYRYFATRISRTIQLIRRDITMKWKGTLRTLAAIQNQAEREARIRQNQLRMKQKYVEKMEELERASYEVELYENNIEIFRSIHKDCSSQWNWNEIYAIEPPSKPVISHENENNAVTNLENFKPGISDRILKRIDSKREELTKQIEIGRNLDIEKYNKENELYESEMVEWQVTHELAEKIIAYDIEAFKQAIERINPFAELYDVGSTIKYKVHNNKLIEITLLANSDEVIPRETKSLLKSGKLSIKDMPKTRFNELYQDYICGCVLRIAREIFALIPFEITIITAFGKLLNTKTGYLEEQPILSVAIPRKTLLNLNFNSIDPSDSMSNFIHNMDFKKSTGFSSVNSISPTDID